MRGVARSAACVAAIAVVLDLAACGDDAGLSGQPAATGDDTQRSSSTSAGGDPGASGSSSGSPSTSSTGSSGATTSSGSTSGGSTGSGDASASDAGYDAPVSVLPPSLGTATPLTNSLLSIVWQVELVPVGGTTKGDVYVTSVARDSADNVYVAGRTTASDGLDLGGGVRTGTSFVASFTSSGAWRWDHFFTRADVDAVQHPMVSVGNGDHVYFATQLFGGPVDYGGGARSAWAGLVIASFDTNGAHRWDRVIDSPDQTGRARPLAFASGGGNIVVGGYVSGNVDFAGQMHSFGMMAENLYVLALDDTGARAWDRVSATEGFVHSVAVATNGDVLASGIYSGVINLGNGPRPQTQYASHSQEGFIARWTSTGTFVWQGFDGMSMRSVRAASGGGAFHFVSDPGGVAARRLASDGSTTWSYLGVSGPDGSEWNGGAVTEGANGELWSMAPNATTRTIMRTRDNPGARTNYVIDFPAPSAPTAAPITDGTCLQQACGGGPQITTFGSDSLATFTNGDIVVSGRKYKTNATGSLGLITRIAHPLD